MIKCHIEEGIKCSVELEGSGKELMQDVGIVITALADTFLKEGVSEGNVKELLTTALAAGLAVAFKIQTKEETT